MHACPLARGRPRRLLLVATRRQRRKVGNLVWPIKSRPTNQQTHTTLLDIYTYKRVVCVCLSVGLSAFYRPRDICPLCGAASEYSESSQAVAGGPTRAARASMHTARARARAYRTTSQRKNRSADAFQKQLAVRARACCRIRNCRDFQKKREKENQHATSQVQFTVCLLLDLIFGRSRPWSARIYIYMHPTCSDYDIFLSGVRYTRHTLWYYSVLVKYSSVTAHRQLARGDDEMS